MALSFPELKVLVRGGGEMASGIAVEEGIKVGDIDPRGEREYCYLISDKARAIAGGVLEAILHPLSDLNSRSA